MRAQAVALAGPGIGWHLGVEGPHRGQPVLVAGAPLARARGALVLAHGRGASALDILDLGAALAPPGWALVAPQAAGGSWYPERFLAPLAANEPGLSSALAALAEIVALLGEGGLPPERVALAGFSQGACLALERAAREPRRYAALLGFSGALIGPPGQARPAAAGSFAGTPALLAGVERDAHVPGDHLRAAAAHLAALGARVDLRLVPGSAHAVRPADLAVARELLHTAQAGGGAEAP